MTPDARRIRVLRNPFTVLAIFLVVMGTISRIAPLFNHEGRLYTELPTEDGYQLMRRIRALASDLGRIPAVAVTGYATSDDVERALEAGFQRHISKPMDPAAFVATVAELARSGSVPPV